MSTEEKKPKKAEKEVQPKGVDYKDKHFVAYTDGGCRWQGSYAGAGVHGYFYDPEKASELLMDKIKSGTITTMGYVDANNPAELMEGDAKIVVPTAYFDGIIPVGKGSTNNVAELRGAIKAVDIALHSEAKSLTIIADSKYVLDGIGMIPTWKANNWIKSNGQPVVNVDHWKEMDQHLERFAEDASRKLSLLWTAGHAGNLGNETADQWATRGLVLAFKENNQVVGDFVDAKGYRNHKADYNRLFGMSHWYFDSINGLSRTSRDGRHVYYCGCHGSDDEVLYKPMSDSSYGVLYLKEHEPVLDMLRDYQTSIETDPNGGHYIGFLQNILSAKTYSDLREHGNRFLINREPVKSLTLAEQTILTKEVRPTRLAWRGEEALTYTRGILELYLVEQEKVKGLENQVTLPNLITYDMQGRRTEGQLDLKLVVTDITDKVYVSDEKAKKPTLKLSDFVGQSTRSVDVKVGYNTNGVESAIQIILTVGIDIPRRNMLSALVKEAPKVKVVTWRVSDQAFRYAVIVETETDAAIWCAAESNLRAVPSTAS